MSKVQRLSREGVHLTTEKCEMEKVATFYFYVLKDPRDLKIKYVGRSVDLTNRFRNHIYEAKKNNRTKKERWIISLLRRNLKPVMCKIYTLTCTLDEAIATEKMLYKKLSSRMELKNMADTFLGNILTGTPVYQYNLDDGKYLKGYSSAFQAQLQTGVKDCNIGRCCKAQKGHAGGFLWSFVKGSKCDYVYNKGLPTKAVIQLSKSGDFIAEFVSAREASKSTGTPYKKISAVCNGRQKTSGGFIWKFKGYDIV